MLDADGIEYECVDTGNAGNPAAFGWYARPGIAPGGTIKPGEIVFGDAAGGLTSSSRLTFTDSTAEGTANTLTVNDGTQRVLLVVADRADTGFGGRGLYVMGFAGGVMAEFANYDPTAGGKYRRFSLWSESAAASFEFDLRAGFESLKINEVDGTTLVEFAPSILASEWWDDLGNPLMHVDHDATGAGQGVYLDTVINPIVVTVAGLAALVARQGGIAWASNGRKTGEGGGAGTGVLCAFSLAGPAGPGWYPVGLSNALVTA
jgi:hypothetical protein